MTTFAAGADLVFNQGITYDTSVAALGTASALACYADGGNRNYGTCNVLTVSGTTVSKGDDLVFNHRSTWSTPSRRCSARRARSCAIATATTTAAAARATSSP